MPKQSFKVFRKEVAKAILIFHNKPMDDHIHEEHEEHEDKATEYFQIKKTLKVLRGDLKQIKEDHEDFDELKRLKEKSKLLTKRIKDSEDVRILEDKIGMLRERQDLIKEIIKAELMEAEEEEIKRDGRKLKLVPTLKEMKDEEII